MKMPEDTISPLLARAGVDAAIRRLGIPMVWIALAGLVADLGRQLLLGVAAIGGEAGMIPPLLPP